MSQAEATSRARALREALLDHGVRTVSIELVQGRSSGGWSDTRFVGTLGHHIVSRRSQGSTPFLHLVKVGRSDLPGPLCNGYGGWDETARIICMGWANHPGAGGPLVVEAGTIPVNNGRPYLFGWEFEGGVDRADWTDSYRTFMSRCLAGTLDWLGHTELSHAEHKTWAPARKVDRLGYTLTAARDEIAAIREGDAMKPPEWARAATQWHIDQGIYTEKSPDDVDESLEFHRQTVFRKRFYDRVVAGRGGVSLPKEETVRIVRG